MMLSHPVLLGFVWSLLFHTLRAQHLNNQDNKVYAYSYHFQHNGTTNSRDILRSVLGTDGEFGFDQDDKSIVKTFSNPNIRGFFTKGVLPAGPLTPNYNGGTFRTNYNANSAINNIRNVIQSNLQPPSTGIARGLLPPTPSDVRNEFPADFNNVNDVGLNFQNQDDFPKIPPPPPLQNQDNFPRIPQIATIPSLHQNNLPEISQPPAIPTLNLNLPNVPVSHSNNGLNKVEKFERETPDGGKIVGEIETFSYNPPVVTNTDSNYHQSAQGFRQNENYRNDNQNIVGHRSQSYFRQQFRTITPNLETNHLIQNSRLVNRNAVNNNNNQWWNVLNVLGKNNIEANNNAINGHHNNANNGLHNNGNNGHHNNVNNGLHNNGNNGHHNNGNNGLHINGNNGHHNNANNFNNNRNAQNLGHQIDQNINQIKANLNNNFNKVFGSRLSNSNNRQNFVNNNEVRRQSGVNQNRFLNEIPPNRIEKNQPLITIPFNNQAVNGFNNQENHNKHSNNQVNNLINLQHNGERRDNNLAINNDLRNNKPLLNNQFNNDDTTRRVFNIINDVSSRLNGNNGKLTNDIGITWDDKPFNTDWSRRQSFGTGRPFSNGHSGPTNNPTEAKPLDVVKTSIDALVGGRDLPVVPISDIGNGGNNYRNVEGGGFEKFFGVNRVVEGPNSFSQDRRRGYERNFHVNSNTGYQRTNQWSTNTVKRLDTLSSRDDFSKDFIDVFRDDY